MTPELTRLLAILAAVIVVVVLAVYWWTQRDPSAELESDAPLPLFGGIQPGERFTPPQPRQAISDDPDEMPPVVPFRAPRTPPGGMPVFKTVSTPPSPPQPIPPQPRAVKFAPPAHAHPPVAPAAVAPPAVAPPAVAPPQEAPPTAPSAAEPAPELKRPIKPADSPKPPPVIREFSTAPTPAKAEPAPGEDQPVVNAAGVPGTMVEGHGLRFSVPAEGTLQFLPGRFEIGSGLDTGREIRFVHVPGPNGMEVTFGRSEGELYRHIQLRDKTVSRQHARMQLREGKWHLVNLSKTNPVAWNGAELESEHEQTLTDGDRIEMGEVVFTFRSR